MRFIQADAFSLDFGELGLFDGVVTDPPYHRSTASNSPVEGQLGCPQFSNSGLLGLAAKATKEDAFLVVTANFPNGAELFQLSKDTCWRWRATQVWDKRPTRTWVSWGLPLKCVEYVLYFTRGRFRLSFKDGSVKPKVNRSSFGGKMKAGRPNTAAESFGMYEEIVSITPPRDRVHPTQKPEPLSGLIARVVGDTRRVLDPFCGSGALLSGFSDSVGVDLKDWNAP